MDAPSAAPAGDMTADTLPAIDAGPAEGDAAAALPADDIAEPWNAAALPAANEGEGAITAATDAVPAIDGIADNGAVAVAADDGNGDRESGELDARGPDTAEAGGTSAVPRDARRHASKDGKERYARALSCHCCWQMGSSPPRCTRHDWLSGSLMLVLTHQTMPQHARGFVGRLPAGVKSVLPSSELPAR